MPFTQLGIKRYLYIQQKGFQAIGIQITAEELNWRTLWKICVISVASGLIVSSMAHYSWQHMRELTLLAASLSTFFEFVLVFWKLGIYLYKRRRIVALVKMIHQMSLEVTTSEFQILVEENLKDAWLSGFYYASVMGAAYLALLAPVGLSVIGYVRTGEFRLTPAFKGSYPFEDNARPPYCFLIYLCTCGSAYFGAYVSIAMDTIYSWFMHNIVAHFRILQLQLENFSEETSESELKNWIRYHQQNLILTEELNIIYGPIVFVQFTLNSIQIGLIAYLIIQRPIVGDFLFLIAFLSAVIIQPSLYCYGGQRVEDESEYTALVIYKSIKWQNWSIKSRKLMQFSMLRAQRSCKLTGIFFVVNLRLFLWVIRTTASYMTLLWSIK